MELTKKRCGCGAEYGSGSWRRVPIVGNMDNGRDRGELLELRQCKCGSLIAKPIGELQTKSGLRKALERSNTDIDAALTNLFMAKAIQTTEVKTRTGVFKGFALRSATRPPSGQAPAGKDSRDEIRDEKR